MNSQEMLAAGGDSVTMMGTTLKDRVWRGGGSGDGFSLLFMWNVPSE